LLTDRTPRQRRSSFELDKNSPETHKISIFFLSFFLSFFLPFFLSFFLSISFFLSSLSPQQFIVIILILKKTIPRIITLYSNQLIDYSFLSSSVKKTIFIFFRIRFHIYLHFHLNIW
jgi:hypothetical protein